MKRSKTKARWRWNARLSRKRQREASLDVDQAAADTARNRESFQKSVVSALRPDSEARWREFRGRRWWATRECTFANQEQAKDLNGYPIDEQAANKQKSRAQSIQNHEEIDLFLAVSPRFVASHVINNAFHASFLSVSAPLLRFFAQFIARPERGRWLCLTLLVCFDFILLVSLWYFLVFFVLRAVSFHFLISLAFIPLFSLSRSRVSSTLVDSHSIRRTFLFCLPFFPFCVTHFLFGAREFCFP